MDSETSRLNLPLLFPGQAQKEASHNEALVRLDLAVGAAVEGVGRDVPPDQPDPGESWIVGPAPVGAWAGQAWSLAGWTEGGWRFIPARPGLSAWNREDDTIWRFDGTDWTVPALRGASLVLDGQQMFGAPSPSIADPSGGGTVDAEARAAINAILIALRSQRLVAES